MIKLYLFFRNTPKERMNSKNVIAGGHFNKGGNKMKIALASDHGGFTFKEVLKTRLKEQGHEIEDFGCFTTESCDYPGFGIPASRSVANGKNERAILICTNGIGMSMLANKFPGIRAALVYSQKTAETTRKHHNSNILCLGAGEFRERDLFSFVEIWLTTDFEGGRHQRRISMIEDMEGLR